LITSERFSEYVSKIIILGFVISLIGFLLVAISSYKFPDSSISTGIVIFIGPIPILLGSGPYSMELIMIGLLMIVLTILLFIFLKSRLTEREVPKESVSEKTSN
jgi:uncharacterized membrane protein